MSDQYDFTLCDTWSDEHPLFVGNDELKLAVMEAHEKLHRLCCAWVGIKKIATTIAIGDKTYNILYNCEMDEH